MSASNKSRNGSIRGERWTGGVFRSIWCKESRNQPTDDHQYTGWNRVTDQDLRQLANPEVLRRGFQVMRERETVQIQKVKTL